MCLLTNWYGGDVAIEHQDWLALGKRTVEIENNILKEERIAYGTLRADVC